MRMRARMRIQVLTVQASLSAGTAGRLTDRQTDWERCSALCAAWRMACHAQVGDSVKDDVVCGNRAGSVSVLLDLDGAGGHAQAPEALAGELRPTHIVSCAACHCAVLCCGCMAEEDSAQLRHGRPLVNPTQAPPSMPQSACKGPVCLPAAPSPHGLQVHSLSELIDVLRQQYDLKRSAV